MAAILWDVDASDGGESLSSPRPTPGDRFWEWVPDYVRVGPAHNALGDASLHAFKFREDYVAHFAIRHLDPSQMALALALKKWLMDGGVVTVVTGDYNDAEYEDLTLRPGTEPKIENENDQRQHFAFRVDLRSSSPILVDYST